MKIPRKKSLLNREEKGFFKTLRAAQGTEDYLIINTDKRPKH